MLARFIAQFALIAASVLLSIWIMQYGWGLEVRSWWWIIGGGFFGNIVLITLRIALSSEEAH